MGLALFKPNTETAIKANFSRIVYSVRLIILLPHLIYEEPDEVEEFQAKTCLKKLNNKTSPACYIKAHFGEL